MNIHEHQAKELLKEFGAPVSKGVVIYSLSEIDKKIKPIICSNLSFKAADSTKSPRFAKAKNVEIKNKI